MSTVPTRLGRPPSRQDFRNRTDDGLPPPANSLLAAATAELERLGQPVDQRPMPALAKLRRRGYEPAVPMAGVVDEAAVTIRAVLDRTAVTEDAAGLRHVVLVDQVQVAPGDVRWVKAAPGRGFTANSERGRAAAAVRAMQKAAAT